MYTKPHFSLPDIEAVRRFVASRSFGVLATHHGPDVFTSPIPIDLREDEKGELFVAGHIARANEMMAAFVSGNAANITVLGPDTYVPAEWFGVRSRIPTWLYAAVEIKGRLEPVCHDVMVADILVLIDRLQKETVEGSTWTLEEINSDLRNEYLKHIAGFRLHDLEIKSCYRLNQNKDHSPALAENLRRTNTDGNRELAEMVENLPTRKSV